MTMLKKHLSCARLSEKLLTEKFKMDAFKALFSMVFRRGKKEDPNIPLEQKIEQGMDALPEFVKRHIGKDPTIKDRMLAITKRMQAEGIDLNSPKAVTWIKKHEKELRQEQFGKVETVVKEKEPGRNDPCPCGSGKKYKKCCGANK